MDASAAIKISPRLLILATLISTLSFLFAAPVRANFDAGLAAFGEGRMKDARIEWQKCANDGHNISQFLLGQLYEEGQGVAPDLVMAHKWYCLAASNDYEEAISYCARVERSLTDEQKKASYRLLQATMPTPAPDTASAPSRQAVASTHSVDGAQAEVQAINRANNKQSSAQTAPDPKPTVTIVTQASAPVVPVQSSNSIGDASVAIAASTTNAVAHPGTDMLMSRQTQPHSAGQAAGKDAKPDESDEDTLTVQKLLAALGHYTGAADGLMGRNTRLAIVAFKTQVGLAADDKIDEATVSAIRQHMANIAEELTSTPVTTGSAVESSLVQPSDEADSHE